MDAAVGSSEPLGDGSELLLRLCAAVSALLAHGMRPTMPTSGGWVSGFLPRRATPFGLLQVRISGQVSELCLQTAFLLIRHISSHCCVGACWACYCSTHM